MKCVSRRALSMHKLSIACGLAAILAASAVVVADVTADEQAMLRRLQVPRVLAGIRHLSEDVVRNQSGVGVGSAVAGSADERALADDIEAELKKIGISVRQETFPVRRYDYVPVVLSADGRSIDAVSLHAAGGTWGVRDGVAYARGNDGADRHRIRAALIDVGDGYEADYKRAGSAKGKVALLHRGNGWPNYQILEAAHQGAAAILIYDYPGGRDDTLKQDSMWYHEQVPTLSIRKADARRLQDDLARHPVEIVLENRIDSGDGWSQNVIGTIAGSDFPDEWITVSAHHDRWFKAAVDDCAGVASMLELARLFGGGGYRPRRSMMFISFGAEEAGIEATESDWLAGSDAFVRQHPEITRRLALAVNIDVTGWGAPKGSLLTTPDNVTFERGVIRDLGLSDRVEVRAGVSSTTDAWNLGSVGGGASALMSWVDATGGVFGGGSSYSAIYHTDRDVFDPSLLPNLEHDLRIEALSVIRADRAASVPIDFGGVVTWLNDALTADAAKAPEASFVAAHAALDRFAAEAARVDRARGSRRGAAQIAPINLWLMRTRKDLMPWLIGRGGAGVRTSAYANQVQTLRSARAAAEKGDSAAAATALARLLGAGSRVSPGVFTDQRLYAYTSGDWSSQFGHRSLPMDPQIFDAHRQLRDGVATTAIPILKRAEQEAASRLADALFVVTGKLEQAARALAETPLQ